jgi:hypothetical protein
MYTLLKTGELDQTTLATRRTRVDMLAHLTLCQSPVSLRFGVVCLSSPVAAVSRKSRVSTGTVR